MPAWDANTNPALFSARVGMCFGPQTEAPVVAVRDVLICPVNQNVTVSLEEFREHPPIASPPELRLKGSADPVDLGRGVRADRLKREEADLVFSACSPRGHYFVPVRQFGQRFAFVREYDPTAVEDQLSAWDPEGVIYDALAYSRLIRDHAFSREWTGRIVDYADGEQMVIYTPGHELKLGYRLRDDRDWLDAEEAGELESLLASYWANSHSFPVRLTRAMWRFEYAYGQRWADVALPTIVGGLEALLRIGSNRLTRQFSKRVPAVAEELGVDGIDTSLARRLYDGRSDWVHASAVRLLQAEPVPGEAVTVTPIPGRAEQAITEVAVLQDVLRLTIRRAIEDPHFRAVFETDDAIQERWPAPPA